MKKLPEKIRKHISAEHENAVRILSSPDISVNEAVHLYLSALEIIVNWSAFLEKDETDFWQTTRAKIINALLISEEAMFDTHKQTAKLIMDVADNLKEAKEIYVSLKDKKDPRIFLIEDQMKKMASSIEFASSFTKAVSSVFCDYYGQNPKETSYQRWAGIYNRIAVITGTPQRGYSREDMFRVCTVELVYIVENILRRISLEINPQIRSSLAFFFKQASDELERRKINN